MDPNLSDDVVDVEAVPKAPHTTTQTTHPHAIATSTEIATSAPTATPTRTPTATPTATQPTTPTPTNATSTPGRRKLKRFTYIPSYDDALLKCVRQLDAHKAEYGQKEKAFETVQEKFLTAIPANVFEAYERPSVKSLRDRFIRLVERRRDTVRASEMESGNKEVLTDVDVLLDDLILEMDEWREELRAEKERSGEREKALLTAGQEIRAQALGRKRVASEDAVDGENAEKKSRKHTGGTGSVLDDVSGCMMDTAERQSAIEEKKLAVDERRFAFERERSEREDGRFTRTQGIAERRQSLDERRFELEKAEREDRMKEEKEERRENREERKAMLSLIQKLMEK